MEIKLKNYNASFDPKKSKMICISNPKTFDVMLAFEFDSARLPPKFSFAMLNMHNGKLEDKKSQFEALKELGKDIADSYNKNL